MPGGPERADGRSEATVAADQVVAYAQATNDANPSYVAPAIAPPVFGVVPTWDATISALDEVVPSAVMPMLLHADQDMRFLRPLRPGDRIATVAATHGVRPTRAGTWVTMRVTSVDTANQEPVLEQFATMFVRGWTELDPSGSERPDRAFPASARSSPVGEMKLHVDPDQTYRYSAASGDANRIHLDDEFARGVGLPGIIVHGMCTMAFCARAVVDTLADGDPTRLARLAVRFSKPVVPGADLVVSMYELDGPGLDASEPTTGPTKFVFEATSGGDRVIRDGLAEIRPARSA